MALLIGCIEAFGMLADRLDLEGPFWSAIGSLNVGFGGLGYLIAALFAVSWGASVVSYRVKGYDRP